MIRKTLKENSRTLILLLTFLSMFSLGLILSLAFPDMRPYSMVYLPMGLTMLFFASLTYLFFRVWKDHKAKAYRVSWMRNLSCRLAMKEERLSFAFSLLPLLGLAVFFARYYFYQSDIGFLIDGNDYYYKFYDALNLESYLICDRLSSALTMSRVFRGFSTIFNDLLVASTIGAFVATFFMGDISLSFRRYLLSPVTLLLILGYPVAVKGIVGESPSDYRLYLMGIELGLLSLYSLSSFLEKEELKISRKKRKALLILAIPYFFSSMSSYTPSLLFGPSIFGLTNPHEPTDLSHRLFLYLAFLLPVYYYLTLSKLDEKERRAALLQLSLGTFFGYISVNRFDIWKDFSTWPLHLCNTAMYTMPITLIFRSYGLYYFTFFINVLGAFLALLMPNFSSNYVLFHPTVMHFYINHLHAFFMPVLIVLLKIYQRPKMKYFLYSQIGFLVYFTFVMFFNVYLTAHGTTSDFFFINSDFVAGKLGKWAKDLFNLMVVLTIGDYTYEIHLLYDIVYYCVYIVLAFGMWFVYELLFRIVDETELLIRLRKENEKQHHYYLKHRKENSNMTENDISLKISHLYKKYNGAENYAVEDFSLSLSGGRIYGFLGKNGAGKSTIIKSIVGIHGFEKGTIEVCGNNVIEDALAAKRDIGFVPDNYALYENLTGRQYIGYIADLFGVSKGDRERREKNLVERLELTQRYDRPMKTYSHGMKQKITIIAALIHEPKVWILDEPMTGLDPNSIFQIKECMKEQGKKGNIVFFSSHIIDVVKNLCDDVIIIKHGHLVEKIDLDAHPERRETLERDFLVLTSDTEEEKNALLKEEAMTA